MHGWRVGQQQQCGEDSTASSRRSIAAVWSHCFIPMWWIGQGRAPDAIP
jgi:hypothetical protein